MASNLSLLSLLQPLKREALHMRFGTECSYPRLDLLPDLRPFLSCLRRDPRPDLRQDAV